MVCSLLRTDCTIGYRRDYLAKGFRAHIARREHAGDGGFAGLGSCDVATRINRQGTCEELGVRLRAHRHEHAVDGHGFQDAVA